VKFEDERAIALPSKNSVAEGVVQVPVPEKASGKKWRLVARYETRLGESKPLSGEPFPVPLVWPEQVRTGEIKARIWSELGSYSLPANSPHWVERNIEEVEDRRELPVLVLHSSDVTAPLLLRAGDQASTLSALVQRCLLRVRLQESGRESWHVSYVLLQFTARDLDILLPGPVPTLDAQFFLNGRKVTPSIVNDSPGPISSTARLHLVPDLIRRTALLEVHYSAPVGRNTSNPMRTTLSPPHLRGVPPTYPCHWIVTIPSNRVLLSPESAFGIERTWMRRGGLLSASLQTSVADLERDFQESLPVELRTESERLEDGQQTPALVCLLDQDSALTLTLVPQQAWLLICSLGILLSCLGVYAGLRPRKDGTAIGNSWLWPFLAFLTLVAALGALFWPTAFWAMVYGCEPGALALLGVLVIQWLLHHRYRRQIVFLPSFHRSRQGSSLLRNKKSARAQNGEPSTVDAPPAARSS
jgi:hypothetical protein